jgi:hypothetical protein
LIVDSLVIGDSRLLIAALQRMRCWQMPINRQSTMPAINNDSRITDR